jgi:hypothetical protein
MSVEKISLAMKDFKDKVLPKKAVFHNSTCIKIQKAIGKFNTKHCLQKGLFIHFEKVGQSTLYKWTKVTLGKQGPAVITRVAAAGGYRVETDFSILKYFFKTEPEGIQGELFP